MDNDQSNVGKKVIAGLTGGVASAVSALLLKKQGFEVIGLSILVGQKKENTKVNSSLFCNIDDLEMIKNLCHHLKISFYATDAKSMFEEDVLDEVLANKLSGNANRLEVKLTQLKLKVLFEKMLELKADFIATGHFCKIHKSINTHDFFIHANNDLKSDQSFLLSSLPTKYLKSLILPLGELREIEVNKIAKEFKLKLKNKDENELGMLKKNTTFTSYARSQIAPSLIKEGTIQREGSEFLFGDHQGMINYYVGMPEADMSEVTTLEKDLEITNYDFEKGIIYLGTKESLTYSSFQLIELELIAGLDKSSPQHCFLKHKSSDSFLKAILYFKNNHSAFVQLDQKFYPLIPGEMFAIYDRQTRNAKVLGSGIVSQREDFKLLNRVADHHLANSEEEDEYPGPERFRF